MFWAGLDGTESVRQHPVNINFVTFVSDFAFFAGRFSIKNNNKMTSLLRIKAHANGQNIVGQQHPTLLGPTML